MIEKPTTIEGNSMRLLLALFFVVAIYQKNPGGPSVPPKPTPELPDGGEFE